MINRRIKKGVDRGKSFEIEVDGEKVLAYKGETIATDSFSGREANMPLDKNKETTTRYLLRDGYLHGVHYGR